MENHKLRVFCLGWYDNDNLGDEAFKPAFQALWPQYEFTFSNSPSAFDKSLHDVVWLGAGSIFDESQFAKLRFEVPYAVIGVTLSKLTPELETLLKGAQIVVVRDKNSKNIWPDAVVAADPVLGRKWKKQNPRKRQIVVLTNDFFNANFADAAWEASACEWAVGELGKLIGSFVNTGYTVKFLPMGLGVFDDRRMAARVINELKDPRKVEWVLERQTEDSIVDEIASSELVITQRFHGLVYSIATSTPCLAISGHTKIWNLASDVGWTGIVDFYGLTHTKAKSAISADTYKFDTYREKAYAQWQGIAAQVAAKFAALQLEGVTA